MVDNLPGRIYNKIMLKEKLIAYLEQHRGTPVSGARLAMELGVTRAAVWKCIEGLRAEGYAIEGKTNQGYVMAPKNDFLSVAGITAKLTNPDGYTVYVHDSLTSTSTEACRLALEGAPHKTAVFCEEQTEGRGRANGSFASPKREGIYMSVVVRPHLCASDGGVLVDAMESAVCRIFGAVPGQERGDVMKDGEKVAGILLESMQEYGAEYASFFVLGVGVYAKWTEGSPRSRNELAAKLLEDFFEGIPK